MPFFRHGPTILWEWAKAPGTALLEQEEGGEKAVTSAGAVVWTCLLPCRSALKWSLVWLGQSRAAHGGSRGGGPPPPPQSLGGLLAGSTTDLFGKGMTEKPITDC